MYCANNNPLSTESSRKIEKIIDKYSMELMHNHTYLSVISASPVVSKHYGTSNYKTESVSCIALYVIVKHFIPINEEPFPQMLDGIPVDVREGGVQFCGASAEDFYDQVRMGCKITSKFQPQKHGTLGGFVEHPDYGLCACAHVVLNDKLKFALKEKMKVKEKEMEPCALFQPSYDTQEQNQIGRLVEVTYKEGGNGKPGIDLALLKIDKRPPSEGTFPDIQGTTTRIRYDSGKVWGKEGVQPNQQQV
ncbi:uncharacterized protein LOC128547485 [Mercenaria mercenaria]|uniref:uncharacterized protein LOC128547485 n=1 Tax=Mercenaria mercenaria TaxID=6596 RepID=UPI00234E8CD1|nr:uncharacterized protein LOC128547485 [Mercenaria mercenaria]